MAKKERPIFKPKQELLNDEQKNAYEIYKNNDIIFMNGVAGTGKSFLAVYFALNDIFTNRKSKIILSRPVVEAGESLGFLPGDVNEKVFPYMLPLYDCLDKICGGGESEIRKKITDKCEIAPLAFLRGRTLENAVCILDEAQNCTASQLKLFLTRIGNNSKMIITGDPTQTDLPKNQSGFLETMNKLANLEGIGVINFTEQAIVRHPLLAKIIKLI